MTLNEEKLDVFLEVENEDSTEEEDKTKKIVESDGLIERETLIEKKLITEDGRQLLIEERPITHSEII